MNIKGRAYIQLKNNNGNTIETIEDNMVTNLLNDIMKSSTNYLYRPENCYSSRFFGKILSQIKPQSLIGGIALFKNKIEENASIIHCPEKPLAYAGTNYDLSIPERGSLNTQESKEISADGKSGYRWVWDFGTSNANGDFNCIGLTTSNAGNCKIDFKGSGVHTISDSYFYYHTETTSYVNTIAHNRVIIDKKGIEYSISSQTDLKIYKLVYRDTWNPGETFDHRKTETAMDLSMFSKISMTLINEREEQTTVRIIGLKNDGWHLCKANLETKTIVDDILLENLPVDYNVSNFSIIGKDDNLYLLFNAGSIDSIDYYFSPDGSAYRYAPGMYIAMYKINTKEFTNKKVYFYNEPSERDYFGNTSGTYSTAYCTVKNGNRYNIMSVPIPKSSGTFKARVVFNVIDEGFEKLKTIPNDLKSDTDERRFLLVSEIYEGIFGISTNNSSSVPRQGAIIDGGVFSLSTGYDNPTFSVLPWGLFTINNLETPIIKTEANTMKITYELTWDS